MLPLRVLWAAARLAVLEPILFSVVVRNFLTSLYILSSHHKNAILMNLSLGVWYTGMIDVASFIPFWLTVNREPFSYFK